MQDDKTAQFLISQFDLGHTPIIKPDVTHITSLCVVETPESPRADVLSIRLLRVHQKLITPVHRHPNKEKAYWNNDPGNTGASVKVFMHLGNRWNCFELKASSGPVIVPANVYHALCFRGSTELTLVASSQDGPTEWEKGFE